VYRVASRLQEDAMSEQAAERAPIVRARLRNAQTPDEMLPDYEAMRATILAGACSGPDLQKVLRVKWRTIYNYCDAGMPYIKWGNERYFVIDQVREWIFSHRQPDRSVRPVGRPRKGAK
jgi:hypothetical protein